MKKLMSVISDTLVYYRKALLFSSAAYALSVLAGILIFCKEEIPINPQSLTMIELFLHNAATAGLILVLGLLSCGILGNTVLITNGVILGRIVIGVYNLYGAAPIFQYIAPHFLFESFALILATALSAETSKLYYNIRHTDCKVIRLRFFVVGILMILLLLLISAAIESRLGG